MIGYFFFLSFWFGWAVGSFWKVYLGCIVLLFCLSGPYEGGRAEFGQSALYASTIDGGDGRLMTDD